MEVEETYLIQQGAEEVVANYEICYEEQVQNWLNFCLCCKRVVDLNVETTLDVYESYTSHSKTLLADIIKNLIVSSPVSFNTTLICTSCYSMIDRADYLHLEFTLIKTKMRDKMYDLIQDYNLKDEDQTCNMNHTDVDIIHTSEDVIDSNPVIKTESEGLVDIEPLPTIQTSKFNINSHLEIWVSGCDLFPEDLLPQYTCYFCFKKFNKKLVLACHVDEEHGKKCRVECRLCKIYVNGGMKTFVNHMSKNHLPDEIRTAIGKVKVKDARLRLSEEDLRSRIPEELEKRKINCLKCNIRLSDDHLHHHLVTSHTSQSETFIKCEVCNEGVSKRIFRRHMLEKHAIGKPLSCSMCGEQFTKRHRMIAHLKRIHNVEKQAKEKNEQCPLCEKKFYVKYDVKRHIRLVHENTRPYVCHTCAATFKSRTDLNRHFLDHTGLTKPFICEICNKAFTRSTHVKKHLRVFHKMDCQSRLNDTLNPYSLPIKILAKT